MAQLKFKSRLLDAIIFGFLLGVLIFVVTQPSREQLLQLSTIVSIALLCMGVGAFLSFVLNAMKIKTLGESVFDPPHLKAQETKTWFKTFWGVQLIVGFIVAFVTGIHVTEFSIFELLSEDGFHGAGRIFSSLLHPNFEILPQALLAIVQTIFMAFTATTLAIPVAFVLSFLCAKNIMGHTPIGFSIYMLLRSFLNVTRSIEPLIWAIIFSVWVGIGPFSGMLALMLHSIASLAKQYSEMIESVDRGPIEGIQSTGAGTLQVLWFAVVPQIILPYVSFTIYRWDINVRMATVIGLVGGGGIGTMLIQYQGQALWNEVGCLVLLIAFVVWAMDTGSAYIREAIK
ncbi:MAG: phosphonate ABC transporter, permease protein PhnE [Bdellovibrionales bacterium]